MRKEKRNIRGHKRSGGIKINNDSSDNEEDFWNNDLAKNIKEEENIDEFSI